MYDSFKIFPDLFSPGYVDLYFEVGYLTTASCPSFPILVGGDTIQYPTHYQLIEIPVGFVAGQTDLSNDILFNIYPNPVKSEINLQFNLFESSSVSIEILDMQGKIVHNAQSSYYQEGTTTIELDLSDLSNGFYNLRLGINDTYYFKKFVKR